MVMKKEKQWVSCSIIVVNHVMKDISVLFCIFHLIHECVQGESGFYLSFPGELFWCRDITSGMAWKVSGSESIENVLDLEEILVYLKL